jgi:hypothetical protein
MIVEESRSNYEASGHPLLDCRLSGLTLVQPQLPLRCRTDVLVRCGLNCQRRLVPRDIVAASVESSAALTRWTSLHALSKCIDPPTSGPGFAHAAESGYCESLTIDESSRSPEGR